jgi:hypothetical protein
MSHHLHYWTQERAEIAFMANKQVLCLESGWYSRLKFNDVIWILTSASREHDLILALRASVCTVEQMPTHPNYAVGNSKIFRNFRAQLHTHDAPHPCRIPLPELTLRQLQFKTSSGLKSLGNEEISVILAGPLASRRKLTDSSADLLENLWVNKEQYPWV